MARHGYRGDGAYGQFCVVLPEQDMVIAITADTADMQAVLDGIWTHLLPAVGEPVPDPAGDAAVADRLAGAELTTLAADPHPSDPDAWDGLELAVAAAGPETPAGLHGARLHRAEDGWDLELVDPAGPVRARVGTGRWLVDDGATPVAISGGWTGDRFRADVIFLETPHRLLVELDDPADPAATVGWRTVPLHALPLAEMRLPRD